MSKFTSRKFIITMLSAISGVALSLSTLGGKVSLICAIISAIVPAITYIITEGLIDAKAVGLITDATKEIAEAIEETREKCDSEQ